MKIEWKDIPNYNGDYQISNVGQVKSVGRKIIFNRLDKATSMTKKTTILKPFLSPGGYAKITLYKDRQPKSVSVHVLVLSMFSPNKNNLLQCNHKNGIKHCNILSNLEWITASENMKHSFGNGRIPVRGEKCWQAKLTARDIIEIRKRNKSRSEISKLYNICIEHVDKIRSGTAWKHVAMPKTKGLPK